MASAPPSDGAAAKMGDENNENMNKNGDKITSVVTQAFPPSHIMEDGRFIHLPPPNRFERSRFFERAIAKYGLLEADMTTSAAAKEQQQQRQEEKEKEEKETAPKVHPLAIASARLQAAGIAELNRAINLSTLVNTGEYFGLTNIVDPSLELGAAKEGAAATAAAAPTSATQGDNTNAPASAAEAAAAGAPTSTAATAPAPASSHPNAAPSEKEMQEEQRVKSAYVLKRKRAIFDKASRVLQRHEARLKEAIVAQAIPDQRLRQLRPQWRLVAPEHGSRAKPHATRPTEVVAVDVDVYDPTGGGSLSANSLVGRLASKVPRFATIELTDQYDVNEQVKKQRIKEQEQQDSSQEQSEDDNKKLKAVKKEEDEDTDIDDDAMEIDVPVEDTKVKAEKGNSVKTEEEAETVKKDEHQSSKYTRGEPFAVADPTLGRISTDFDPDKVSFLTLQFDIEKPSTGFCMSSCLEPMATTAVEKAKEQEKKEKEEGGSDNTAGIKKEDGDNTKSKVEDGESPTDAISYPEDEQVLVSLQHSLFCAKLFESIRKELMGDDNSEGQRAPTQAEAQRQQPVAWLSSESEENFLPPPSIMIRPTTNSSGAELCVIHCHASEIKVQLDNEYTLRAKLVEASEQNKSPMPSQDDPTTSKSGSQTPQQLHLLCRSLLLHAQEVYHKHSSHETMIAAEKQRQEEERKLEPNKPKGLDRIQKQDLKTLPKILQSCVGLGTKMLFEHRIRKSLVVRLTEKKCIFFRYEMILIS